MTVMEYAPPITEAKTLRVFEAGEQLAMLLGNIKSEGTIEYLYVLSVFRAEDNELCLCVASEKNNVPMEGAGSHFLGVFPGAGHENRGLSDDWADQEKFTAKALTIAKEKLGIRDEFVEVLRKKPWWKFSEATV